VAIPPVIPLSTDSARATTRRPGKADRRPPALAGPTACRARWLAELDELLAFPTVSAQPRHRGDIEAAARWLARHLDAIGRRRAAVLPGPNGGAPSVYADWLGAPGKPTLLLYGHYDVQPAEPLAEWRTPPFRATVLGKHLYARGASDDKGQLFIHLKALESLLTTTGRLPLNVKVWLEGEEEIGSPNLAVFLDRELSRLRADAVLVSDTEMPAPGRPAIVYGLRGNLSLELEVRAPMRELHSGRYGGAVLNPLQALCELIAGLHDRHGRVTIPGFYHHVRPVAPDERQRLRRDSPSDERFLTSLGVRHGWGEEGYTARERATIRPALIVEGLTGGYTGPSGKAVIPDRALARLGARLVPDQDPAEIAQLLRRHLVSVTPPAVRARLTVTGGSRPVLIPRRHAAMAAASRAVEHVWGAPPVFMRSGGSIAVVEQLRRRLGAPIVLLGFGLPDDAIHAPNERIHLPTLFRGVDTVAAFLREYGETESMEAYGL